MILPEGILITAIKSLIKMVGDDYLAQSDKTKSMLYDLFYNDDNGLRLGLDKYFFYEQAIVLFTRNQENPRKIDVHIGFNMEQQGMLAVHVMLPRDSPGRYDSIGHSVGEIATTYDVVNQVERQTLISTFDATYQLVITSDNQNEILLLYWFLKNCFTMLSDHLELMGLRNNRISGADIRLEADGSFAPANIFHRSLTVQFDYEIRTKVNFFKQMANKIHLFFCASIDTDYTAATNDGGLVKAISPTLQSTFSGTYRNIYQKRIITPNTFTVQIPFSEHQVLFAKDVVVLNPSDKIIDVSVNINQGNLMVTVDSDIDLNGYLITIF